MTRCITALVSACFAALLAPAADPAASCGKVSVPEGMSVASGSGTVVACEGGKSLVLTNRHVCPRLGAGPSFELSGKRYSAFCCCVDDRADLALLLVDAELPACVVAAKCPADGTEVRQYGHPYAGPQKPKQGLIQRFMGWLRDGRPVTHSGIQTEQGDSGCGVFAGNELVAVTWGEGGSCVHLADVRRLLGVFAEKTKAFPKLGAAMRAATVDAPKSPALMMPPVTIDRAGSGVRVYRNDRASEAITLPADATEAQVRAACVKLAPELYGQLPNYPPAAPTCPGGVCPVPPFRPAFRPLTLGGS